MDNKIIWKDYNPNNQDNTPIPDDVWGFIKLLYSIDVISNIPINAEFMNKYHPEILWQEYIFGVGKTYEELKDYFKDLKENKMEDINGG